jgi:hypothetical protein
MSPSFQVPTPSLPLDELLSDSRSKMRKSYEHGAFYWQCLRAGMARQECLSTDGLLIIKLRSYQASPIKLQNVGESWPSRKREGVALWTLPKLKP